MTASALACPSCHGRPHRYDSGCARCDDTGTAPPSGVYDIPRLLPLEARERAELALRAALVRAHVPDADSAARRLVAALESEPSRDETLAIVRRLSGHEDAAALVSAYARAVDEAGRIRNRNARWGEDDPGEWMRAHARRVEMAIEPAWMRWLR